MLTVSESNPPNQPNVETDEPPPVLGSWKNFYVVVVVNTVIVFLLLWLFSYYSAR
jgi:hypothetical protein